MFKKVLIITLLSISCINASDCPCGTKNIIEQPINYNVVQNKISQNLVYAPQKQCELQTIQTKKAQNNSWWNCIGNYASWVVKGTAGAILTAYVVVPKNRCNG